MTCPVIRVCPSEIGQSAFLPTKMYQGISPTSLKCPLELKMITNGRQPFSCLAWAYPQTKERNSFCELATAVCSMDAWNLERAAELRIESFEVVELSKAADLRVTVLCGSVKSSLKHQDMAKDRLANAVKLALNGLIVKQDCIVNLPRDQVFKSNGISAILIDFVKSEESVASDAFEISDGTILSVNRVVSKLRYGHEQSGKLPRPIHLGGMEQQMMLLENIILNAKNRANAMRGFLLVGPPGSGKSTLINQVGKA